MKITTNLVENFPVFLVNLLQYIHNQFVISLGWIQVRQPKKSLNESWGFFNGINKENEGAERSEHNVYTRQNQAYSKA